MRLRPRRGYADGPFGQVHYQHLGAGHGRPLVLLHQAPMTSGQFDRVYAPLAAHGLHAIGIDMPGFGGSDPTPHPPGVADYGAVVPAVLDALGLPQAALLGHHTGAMAAAESALAFPRRISALVLNGPLLVSEAERQAFDDGLHPRERAFRALPDAAHMVAMFQTRARLAAGSIDDERLSDYVVQALSGRGPYWWGHHAAYHHDMASALARLRLPTLILTNSGDLIHDSALRARQLRPDFAWHCLAGGGIDIVDQQPQAWADAVATFLAQATPAAAAG